MPRAHWLEDHECQHRGEGSTRRVAIREPAAGGVAQRDAGEETADDAGPRFERRPDERSEQPAGEKLQDEQPGVGEEDDDPDMIPLIDISLVLLIFFMMTSTVAVVSSQINVPEVQNGSTLAPPRDH